MAETPCNAKITAFIATLKEYPSEAADGAALAGVLAEIDARLNAVAAAFVAHGNASQKQVDALTVAAPQIGQAGQ